MNIVAEAWHLLVVGFTEAGDQTYLPYVVLAAVAVVLVTRLGIADWSGAVTADALRHRSTRHDAAMYVSDRLVVGPLIALLPLPSVLTAWTHTHLSGLVGDHRLVTGWAAAVVVTLFVFLAIDFANFFAHYLQHKVGVLWHFHAVHHSAPVMTPATAYRNHPLDELVQSLNVLVVLGLSRGVAFVFVEPRREVSVLGYNVAIVVGLSLFATLRHSGAWITFGGRVERVVASPAQHLIHHSSDPADHDRNFGSFLSIWDRMFGTFVTAAHRRPVTFGLGPEANARYGTLRALYVQPFRDLFAPTRSTPEAEPSKVVG